jgi:hypothetical protein
MLDVEEDNYLLILPVMWDKYQEWQSILYRQLHFNCGICVIGRMIKLMAAEMVFIVGTPVTKAVP